MKISKSLLQAIALGVTLGAVSTSCSKDQYKVEPQFEEEATFPNDVFTPNNTLVEEICPANINHYDCPGCGMG